MMGEAKRVPFSRLERLTTSYRDVTFKVTSCDFRDHGTDDVVYPLS